MIKVEYSSPKTNHAGTIIIDLHEKGGTTFLEAKTNLDTDSIMPQVIAGFVGLLAGIILLKVYTPLGDALFVGLLTSLILFFSFLPRLIIANGYYRLKQYLNNIYRDIGINALVRDSPDKL